MNKWIYGLSFAVVLWLGNFIISIIIYDDPYRGFVVGGIAVLLFLFMFVFIPKRWFFGVKDGN